MTALLRVEKLRVRLASRLVVDIDELELAAGGLTVLLGGAGSGKSVLAAALAGTLPAAGSVTVAGRRLEGSPAQRRRLGLAATVRDGQRISGCTVAEALALASPGGRFADQMLERFPQLGTRRHVAAQLLSGGEQQLLQVACAWCARAPVLVLDSPTVGLAGDAAATVTALAREHAGRERLVLWLEQDPRAAPSPPAWRLVRGRVEALAEAAAESPSSPSD